MIKTLNASSYKINVKQMNNDELIREQESVESLTKYTSKNSIWPFRLEMITKEMEGRGLKSIN